MKNKTVGFALLTMLVLVLPCRAKQRGFFSGMRRLLFPPKDLFELVVKTEIDIGEKGSRQDVPLRIRYDGPYTYGIIIVGYEAFKSDVLQGKGDTLTARLKVDFVDGTNLLHSANTSADYSPFMGLRGSGLMLGRFEAPEEVPIKKDITCRVTVLSPDAPLSRKYGPIVFYIQKASEM